MTQQKFITPVEVAANLGISKSYAYKLVREMNAELKSKGYMVISGKVSRAFYEEKFYGCKEGT